MRETIKSGFSRTELNLFGTRVPNAVLLGNMFGIDMGYDGIVLNENIFALKGRASLDAGRLRHLAETDSEAFAPAAARMLENGAQGCELEISITAIPEQDGIRLENGATFHFRSNGRPNSEIRLGPFSSFRIRRLAESDETAFELALHRMAALFSYSASHACAVSYTVEEWMKGTPFPRLKERVLERTRQDSRHRADCLECLFRNAELVLVDYAGFQNRARKLFPEYLFWPALYADLREYLSSFAKKGDIDATMRKIGKLKLSGACQLPPPEGGGLKSPS